MIYKPKTKDFLPSTMEPVHSNANTIRSPLLNPSLTSRPIFPRSQILRPLSIILTLKSLTFSILTISSLGRRFEWGSRGPAKPALDQRYKIPGRWRIGAKSLFFKSVTSCIVREGVVIMYNGAFRVTISGGGVSFLGEWFDFTCSGYTKEH